MRSPNEPRSAPPVVKKIVIFEKLRVASVRRSAKLPISRLVFPSISKAMSNVRANNGYPREKGIWNNEEVEGEISQYPPAS